MRKIPVFVLLSVFLLTQVFSLWYLYKPLSHIWFESMHEIKHAWFPNKTTLICIQIDAATLKDLQQDESEIMINGMLYDIDHLTVKDKSITLYLECDAAETKSNNGFAQLTKQIHSYTGENSSPAPFQKVPFFTFLYYNQLTYTIAIKPIDGKLNNPLLFQKYRSYFPAVLNPPPEQL